MKQYQQNIELVDPQLKNNAALVQVVTNFEDAWSLGQNQIGTPERLEHLDKFSKLLEQTCRDVPSFNEQVECRDSSIFMSIPALLVLETLLLTSHGAKSGDSPIWPSLCSRFKEDIILRDDFKQAA